MGNDLDLPEWSLIHALSRIHDGHQTPVRKKGGDGVTSFHIVLCEIGWLTVQQEQFLEVNDEVPALLVKNVAALIELVGGLARRDSDSSESLTNLQKIIRFV